MGFNPDTKTKKDTNSELFSNRRVAFTLAWALNQANYGIHGMLYIISIILKIGCYAIRKLHYSDYYYGSNK